MIKNTDTKSCEIYLVLSQTGSIISRLLKIVTKAKYNHSSISITKDMTTMYSFGRFKVYNAFRGGYIRESINEGMYKRFKDTDAAVFVITVTEETYNRIREKLEGMYENREQYSYDMIGIMTAFFGCHFRRRNKYYCSDFVYEVLADFDIVSPSSFDKIIKPIDFYPLFCDSLIYEGKFRDYTPETGEFISV